MKNGMNNTAIHHAVMKTTRVKNNVIQNTTRETTSMNNTLLKNAVMKTAMMKNGVIQRVTIKSAVMENAKNVFCKQHPFLACMALSLLLLGCANSPDATCPLPQDGVCAALHTVDKTWNEKTKKEASLRKKTMPAQASTLFEENKEDAGIMWFFPDTKAVDPEEETQEKRQNHHSVEVNHATA